VEFLLLVLAGWLDAAGLVDWARGTSWVYPFANVLHVIGVVMLVGGIGIVDLRVAGLWRRLPLVALSRALTPVAAIGLAVQFASGLVLFAADAEALSGSTTFHIKLVLLVLALANAAAFRMYWHRNAAVNFFAPSPLAKVSALVSLALWLAIATVGRLIAYY
jgi:hypothetical protein